MTTTKQVPQHVLDLQATREVLEKGNWIKGSAFRPPDSFCVSGAVARAIVSSWPETKAAAAESFYNNHERRARHWMVMAALRRALGARCPSGWEVEQWNDTLAKTKEEVLKLIDEAIANELNVPQLMEVR